MMANLDLTKISKEIGNTLTTYINQFLEVLTSTKIAIKKSIGYDNVEFDPNKEKENQRIKSVFIYSLISITVGVFIATFVNLSDTPATQNMGTIVAVLFIWILFSILLHPFLKLFGGKGKLKETMIVFLLIVSTIHIIWIPIVSIASKVLTQTRVYLTYDYVISFSSTGWTRYEEMNLLSGIEGNFAESYIKEEEPKKEGTILAPVDTSGIYDGRVLLYDPEFSLDRKRIKIDSVNRKYLELSENTELKKGGYRWISLISIIYYLSNCLYLAIGLSIPHKVSTLTLFMLAILAPVVVIGVLVFLLTISTVISFSL